MGSELKKLCFDDFGGVFRAVMFDFADFFLNNLLYEKTWKKNYNENYLPKLIGFSKVCIEVQIRMMTTK